MKSYESYTIKLNGKETTFQTEGRTLRLKNDPSLSWASSQDIRHLSPVFNSTCYLHVNQSSSSSSPKGSSVVLECLDTELRSLAKLQQSPHAVYLLSNYLVYNVGSSCFLRSVKTGKQTGKLNHQLIGFDRRAGKFIFKTTLGEFKLGLAFTEYHNLLLDSVSSIPASWLVIISSRSLVLATALNRIMFVHEGVIKSHYKLEFSVRFVEVLSDTSIQVSGDRTAVVLSIPELTQKQPDDVTMAEEPGVVAQLIGSCDKLIQSEIRGLQRLYQNHEKKHELLVRSWKSLFSLSEQITEELSGNKRRRVGSSTAENTPSYQIPASSSSKTRTSVYLDNQQQITVFCSNPDSEPIHNIDRNCVVKSHKSFTPDRFNQTLSPEFKEKVRKLFAENLLSNPKSDKTAALAELARVIRTIEDV